MATLFGRYEYVAELGRGASSRVLHARDLAEHGAARALKIVAPDAGARLSWEVARLREIEHPNVARVRELLRVEHAVHAPFALVRGAWVLVEDLALGEAADLALDPLREDPRALLGAVFRVALGTAEALAALHRVGLVHGDVKPANVLVTPHAKKVTLIDLGAARVPGFHALIQGTPDYLSPEVWAGSCSFAQDTYALGATLFDLFEGARTALPSQVGSAPWRARDVSTLPAWMPQAFCDLLRRLLSLELEARPFDAMRVLALLHALGRRLHLGVPRSAALYATGRVAPSARELSARALSAPFVGHSGPRERLEQALMTEGVVFVQGAPGSGRTRLVREALHGLQLACVTRNAPTPTLLPDLRAAEQVEVARAIVYQSHAQPEHVELARRAVAAWSRLGRQLSVVLEVDNDQSAQGSDEVRVALLPLPPDAEQQLLRAVLGEEVTEQVRRAAHLASGGYGGRLCVLMSQGLLDGRSLLAVDEWTDLTLEPADLGALSADALRLARVFALSSGQLSLEAASQLLGSTERVTQARHELLARALLFEAEDGAVDLHRDLASRVRIQLGLGASVLAREVGRILPVQHRALWVHILCDDADAGQATILAEGSRLRAAGEPRAARAFLREALSRMESEPVRIALAEVERALGCYEDAHLTLSSCQGEAALLLHAEVQRLRGHGSLAFACLERLATSQDSALRERAAAVRARLAFDAGDFEQARREVVVLPSDALARLRVREVRNLLALQRGDASEETVQQLAEARQLGDARSISRALMLSAQSAARAGHFSRAAHELREAKARSRDAGEAHEAATIALNLGLIELDAGELGASLTTLRHGAAALVWLGREGELARALYNLGNAAWLVGDVELAEASLSEARERAERGHDRALQVFLTVAESEFALHRGEVESAYARLATELARATDASPAARCFLACRTVCAALIASDAGGADAALKIALEVATLDASLAAERAIALARCLLARGDARAAEDALLTSVGRIELLPYETRLRVLLTGVDSARALGSTAQADLRTSACRALLERVLSMLEPEARTLFRALPAHARALAQGSSVAHSTADRESSSRRLILAARRLFEATSERRLARLVAQIALELVQAERALVIIQAADGSAQILAGAWLAASEGLPFSRSIVEQVWAEMTTLVTTDAQHDARLDAAQSVHSLGVRSVIAVPVRAFAARAVIYLDDRLRAGAFGAHEREQLSDFAQLSAAAFRVVATLKNERRAARAAQHQVRALQAQLAQHEAPIEGAPLVGESRPLMNALHLARRVASSNTPVLIQGESGTGKELLARFVHAQSERSTRPFVAESCAALPETLLESALFGHERGAFTGADRARAGLFELAHTGTLFLDEVAEMSPSLQAKLLRVLQDGEVRPVGSEKTRHVDVRVLTATHRDLTSMVAAGNFREDLLYRIAVITIELPPLRDRLEDIPLLVAHFLAKHRPQGNVRMSNEALENLQRRAWPGNVRQLESELQRALALGDDLIDVEHLSVSRSEPTLSGLDLRAHTEALQRNLVRRALEEAQGNQTRAALLLGLSRFGLQKMLKRLGLSD